MAVTEPRSGSRLAVRDGVPWAICCASADLLQKWGLLDHRGAEPGCRISTAGAVALWVGLLPFEPRVGLKATRHQ